MKRKNYTFVVMRKEFKDAFRDRKTIITGLLLPVLIYPLLLTFMGGAITGAQREAELNTTVAMYGGDNITQAKTFFEEVIFAGTYVEFFVMPENEAKSALADGDMKLAVGMSDSDVESLLAGKKANITLYYDDTKTHSMHSHGMVMNILYAYNGLFVEEYLRMLGIVIEDIQPLEITPRIYIPGAEDGAADVSRGGNQMLSLMVPMILVIMLAVGSMAAAVDMFAGEKERKTMEPLLSTHAGRGSILTGKFLAVSNMGILSSVLMLGGLIAGYALNPSLLELDGDSMGALNLPFPAVFLCVLLIIMVQLIFSGLHVCLSSYARNVKEATTYGSLLMMAGMIPAYATMFMQAGDISRWMMFVPVLNVVGALKMLLGGMMDYTSVIISLSVSVVFLVALLVFTSRLFHKESIMLRS
jgi:sodium transport system permease protein